MNMIRRTHLRVSLAVAMITLMISARAQQSDQMAPPDLGRNPAPGQNLGIASVPNLRDVGGYTTRDGAVVRKGLAYRSDELNPVSTEDLKKIAELGLKNDFDLRTTEEVKTRPDELPPGVKWGRTERAGGCRAVGPGSP
jgi:protein-tyrosine phosphatase